MANKNNNLINLQKSVFYVFLSFFILCQFINEVTKIQALPFLLFSVGAYFFIYQKKTNFNIGLTVIAFIMLAINLITPKPSWLDVLLWGLALSFFFKGKNTTRRKVRQK